MRVTRITGTGDAGHGKNRCDGSILANWVTCMSTLPMGTRLILKNLLFLSDFSDASELAIPYAVNLAKEYEGRLHALHVVTPVAIAYTDPVTAASAIDAIDEGAQSGMQRVEVQLMGVDHQTILVRGDSVWPSVRRVLQEQAIDLLILGTHGRTGSLKMLMGSVAEEIFRKSSVPVLTIGPAVRLGAHNGGRFHNILYATDFSPEAAAALPYAVSLAEENQARLQLLHVLPQPKSRRGPISPAESVADVMHQLQGLVPGETGLWCRPESIVRFGEPANRILAAARESNSDLIVMGVKSPGSGMGIATHLEGAVAHEVVTHAICPVLTKRL
jgi:nucleotide-binding universal stress UspA family protein